jgi:hypothetical protein
VAARWGGDDWKERTLWACVSRLPTKLVASAGPQSSLLLHPTAPVPAATPPFTPRSA